MLPRDPQGGQPWGTSKMVAEHYDPCSPLSWIMLTTDEPGRFTPYTVAFFHFGKLVGPAGPIDPSGDVERIAPNKVRISWWSPRNASENKPDKFSLKTTSVFTWNDASGSITRTGTLPPSHQ